MSIKASNLRPIERNTLRAFVTLTLEPSGIVLNDCTLHRTVDGRQWIGLPGKPQLDADGRQRRDPGSGKALYTPVVEIQGKEARERFQAAALGAVDKLLGEGT